MRKTLITLTLLAGIGAHSVQADDMFSALEELGAETLSHTEMADVEGKYYFINNNASYGNYMYGPYGMVGTTWRPTQQQRTYGIPGISYDNPIYPQVKTLDNRVSQTLGMLRSVGINIPNSSYGFQGKPFNQMYGSGLYGGYGY